MGAGGGRIGAADLIMFIIAGGGRACVTVGSASFAHGDGAADLKNCV